MVNLLKPRRQKNKRLSTDIRSKTLVDEYVYYDIKLFKFKLL